MDTLTIILLIVIPYIVYKLFLKFLEDKHDIEMSKMAKSMIFFIIDTLIMIIASSLGK